MPDDLVFERGEVLYPQPVAIACSRIRRAADQRARLDTILKCSEILTRYIATLAIASFSAREDADAPVPDSFQQFSGRLNWGDFLGVAQAAAATAADHPLRGMLRPAFQGRYPSRGKAEYGLTKLLNLRNELGHDLSNLDEARADEILNQEKPDEKLVEALIGLGPVLCLPLFCVSRQSYDDYVCSIRRSLLMGQEDDPVQENRELNAGVSGSDRLYVGVSDGVICLTPLMLWTRARGDTTHRVFLLNAIEVEERPGASVAAVCREVNYKSVSRHSIERDSSMTKKVRQQIQGAHIPVEHVHLRDGRSFVQEWMEVSRERGQLILQEVPWDDFDKNSVRWYGQRLGAVGRRGSPPSPQSLHAVIAQELLGGRLHATPDEIRQLTLLLGTKTSVKRLLGRRLLDMRATISATRRWDERKEITSNIIECLGVAIDFLSNHTLFHTRDLDRLQAEGGSVDYIAMREALINLFAHQDYHDTSAPAQIQVTPEKVIFFNPGKSLVDEVALGEGGRSLSRNPLLSEAFKLIGFVERAGSGLQQVRRAYQTAHRPPPRIVSNSDANTFEITLQFEAVPPPAHEFWQQRLGVTLTPLQATALVVLVDGPLPVDELADRLGVTADEAEAVCQVLTKEVLIETIGDRVALAERLRPLAEEARERGL